MESRKPWVVGGMSSILCALLLGASLPGNAFASGTTPSANLAYPPLPPGFNPVTATASQLAYYGLPPRPPATHPRVLAGWITAMEHAKHEVGSPTTNATMAPLTGNNWSGYYSLASNNGNSSYVEVSANWTVPTVNNQGSNEVGSWIGIGGVGTTAQEQQLQQAGVISVASNPGSYYFFWENFNQTSGPVRLRTSA